MPTQTTKSCSACKIVKPNAEFYNTKRNIDGLDCYCIPCRKKKSKRWSRKNRKRKNEHERKRYQENKERISQEKKIYWAKNKNEINARRKEMRKGIQG